MILVAGCGYLGARIAALLHDSGRPVVGLTHSADSAAMLASSVPWTVEACDISDESAVKALAAKLGAASVPMSSTAPVRDAGAQMPTALFTSAG